MDALRSVYAIGLPGSRAEGPLEEVGFKAWNLARMAAIGLPVPPAFVLGTPLCQAWATDREGTRPQLRALLEKQIERLEMACGLEFGSERKPLLVSVRSGAPVSMPGMMDTLLDVGLTDATLRGLLRLTGNPRLVWDSYRRLVQQFAEVVHGARPEPFQAALHLAMERSRVGRPQDLDFRALATLARSYLEIFESQTGHPFPQDPQEQLLAATGAVFDSWQSPRATEYRTLRRIDHGLGTAVTVQRMVFGNAGGTSGAGVGFTRDPASGENRLYLDFRFNAQGEDVVSGRHSASETERLALVLPSVHTRLKALQDILEREFGDVQEFEFTVQEGVLYLLQTRKAKRTPWAALRIAIDMVSAGLWEPATALDSLADVDLERISHTRIVGGTGCEPLAQAIPASLGVATGVIALSADAACRNRAADVPTILVRDDISTADLAGIAAAHGVLTARGGRTAHAAVIARQLGKPCLVGCGSLRVDLEHHQLFFGTRSLHEGDLITVDCEGAQVLTGAPEVREERPSAWLETVARWQATASTVLS